MGQFLRHAPCPACGSSDARSLYDDGSEHCFACLDHTNNSNTDLSRVERKTRVALLPIPEPTALEKRQLTLETCKRWRYGYGALPHPKTGTDSRCQVATYFDPINGQPVAQKVRFADKEFLFMGGKDAPLYGQHLWRDGGKRVVITEGEIDAMSVDQVLGHKWPVVSVPNGSSGAKAAIARQLEWLNRFEEVVLAFDMDAPGRAAVEECAALFPAGKVRVALLPAKDANEMVQAGKSAELRAALWEAKEYRPDGILRVCDVADEACKDQAWGLPWPWKSLTEYTYGIRRCELYGLGAGTGVGKTDVFTQMVAHLIDNLNLPVATFFLEQPPTQTALRIAGKMCGRRLHLPTVNDAAATEARKVAIKALEKKDKLYMYDCFGSADWDQIASRTRFLAHNYGIKDFFLDHLTALAAGEDDERQLLARICKEMSMLAMELKVTFYFVSHLCTPEGKPHEEGGRVMTRHFKGARDIGFWSHFMFGLERNQQAEDELERRTTTLRILKDRFLGTAVGKTVKLVYNPDTGLLEEATSETQEVF